MANTVKRLAGPAFLGAAAADIYTPPASTMYILIRQIHLANVTAGALSATAYIGASGGSAAGTEIFKAKNVPANDYVDLFFQPGLPMKSTDFLSGLASAGSSITITVMGEQIVVP